MNPRTTAVLFLVAGALFAFVYFYEIAGEEGRREAEERAKRLFPDVESADVTSIELVTSDGTAARIERRDGAWSLVEPVEFPADTFAADGMATALADLKSEAVYEDPQPPGTYGLDEERGLLRFEADGEQHGVRIGDKTPIGSNTYVSVEGAEPVYTVATFATNALRKSLDDLRDKRVARFDRERVDRVVAQWPGGGVTLERDGEEWRITSPIQARADVPTVDSLLTDLSFLRASGFVDTPPPDEESGLDAPEFALELSGAPQEEGGEPLEIRVAFGARRDGETRLVRSAQPSLYRIPAERLKDFPRDLVAYRYRTLAPFALTEAQRIELVFQPLMSTPEGDQPVVITATRGETGWTAEPEAFQSGKLTTLVTELAGLRAENILADEMGPDELAGLGLEPPHVSIRVFGEEGDEPLASLRLGATRGDSGIAAQVEGDPLVYEVGYDLAEYVPVSLEAFRNRFRAAPEPEPEETQADAPEPAAAPEETGAP